MNELVVKGKTKVCGIEVPNVYGGFGENQKVILAKTVSELHGVELKVINQNVNRHIEDGYFEEGIDFIDVKGTEFEVTLSDSGIYTKNAINASKNIYLFSQQGYTLLLKLMNSELAKKQYKQVVRDYFTIREAIHLLTKEDLLQLIARTDGIIRRNRETEAISRMIQRGELKNEKYPYATITNTTYDILYGMYAKQIKQFLDLRQQDNLRDFLSKRSLDEIREIEDEIHWMEKKGYSWKKIYCDLLEEYPDKSIPIKADKSIKEIKKSNKLSFSESEIKQLN